jgi:enolase-phosphatase E1
VKLHADVALIDIEGTVGSIAFVRDVLFPYADERMDAFVQAHEDDPSVRALLDETARIAGADVHDLAAILRALHEWSAADAKIPPFKGLQGKIWAEGFHKGEIRGEIYADALAALRRFHAAGVKLYVYSSGSVAAQKLVFGFSVEGDLLPLFSGFFDTTMGSKTEPASYERIVGRIEVDGERIVFFSDNVKELDAARLSGMHTVQLARPEDGVTPAGTHREAATFDGIDIIKGH